MTVAEAFKQPEIRALRERYHDLTGCWLGYHWRDYGSIEDYVEKLKEKIAKAEKGKEYAQNH